MLIRDRIKELRRVRSDELLPNPKNFRTHPEHQQNVLKGLLAEIGFADACLARETEHGLMLIDGHLRCETAPDSEIPVLVLDVTEEEADKILATLDPLAAIATTDSGKLGELLAELSSQSAAVEMFFNSLAEQNGIFGDVQEAELPELPSGDRTTMRTMNFTLSAEQEQTVKDAVAKAKSMGEFVNEDNGNSNGNALARVCEIFLGGE